MSRVDDLSGQVSGAFGDWLKAEVYFSGLERNKYLDEYDRSVEGLKGGWDNRGNFSARKEESHFERLPHWFEGFRLDPSNDYQAAKLIFASLMHISGNYRVQCYVQAQDGEEYMQRRSKAVGIDMEQPVSVRLHTHLPNTGNFATAKISLESVNERRVQAQNIGLQCLRALCDRVGEGHDLGQEHSLSVNEMLNSQYNWLTFATDCLTLVAKKRDGELAAVPFLEPRSITDQSGELHYPLGSPVDWREVLAA